MPNLQLVFAGEVLEGFVSAEVRRSLGQQLKLDDAKLDKLFSGQRIVIKRGLSSELAEHWVAQFQALGALLHARAEPAAVPRPAMGDPQIPAPPPIAVNTPPVTEEITCPACGEHQPKRILCRNCACDMPRGIAAKEEEAAAERALRRQEFMKRHGVRETTPRTSGHQARLAAESVYESGEDAPLFGLSFTGRIGRMRSFLGGLLMVTCLVWLIILVAWMPGPPTFVVLVLGLAFGLVWGCRLTALRLHDVNRSAWWQLLFCVPYLGNLAGLVLTLWPGDAEENEYGKPPAESGSLPVIGVLVVLCLTVAMGWNLTWSAFQRQMAAMQAEADHDEDGSSRGDVALPPSSDLARVLHSDAAVDEFRRYMATPGHRAFAVSQAGAWGWHGGAARPEQSMDTAVADCERRRRPYTPACQVVHLNDHWAMN